VFAILSQGQIIGYSRLEHGDAPMGVAFGGFVPCANFEAFTHKVEPDWKGGAGIAIWSGLQAVSPGNTILECLNVAISTSNTDNVVQCEVEILGIHSSHYHEFFSHHLEAYERKLHPPKK